MSGSQPLPPPAQEARETAAHIGAAIQRLRGRAPYWVEKALLKAGAWVLSHGAEHNRRDQGDDDSKLIPAEVRAKLFAFAGQQHREIVTQLALAQNIIRREGAKR
jgi:hypothetical protein